LFFISYQLSDFKLETLCNCGTIVGGWTEGLVIFLFVLGFFLHFQKLIIC